MIIGVIGTKGGSGKTTLSVCLAMTLPAPARILDLDPQGTAAAWRRLRQGAGPSVETADAETAPEAVKRAARECETVILDCPGEGRGAYATRFALAVADVAVLPARQSWADEASLGARLLPVLRDLDDAAPAYVLPAFVHPSASEAGVRAYWRDILPPDLDVLPAVMRQRAAYELALREGGSLGEYRRAVRRNRRERKAAEAAVTEMETIARCIASGAR